MAEGPSSLIAWRIGFGRIAVAPPAQIDGSDHLPALAFFGMLSEARLDAGDERFEIPIAGGIFEPRGERLVRQAGRAVR